MSDEVTKDPIGYLTVLGPPAGVELFAMRKGVDWHCFQLQAYVRQSGENHLVLIFKLIYIFADFGLKQY